MMDASYVPALSALAGSAMREIGAVNFAPIEAIALFADIAKAGGPVTLCALSEACRNEMRFNAA